MKNYLSATKIIFLQTFRQLATTLLLFLLLVLSACVSNSTLPSPNLATTEENSTLDLPTATASTTTSLFPIEPTQAIAPNPAPDTLGTFQFHQYTYSLHHDFDYNACTLEPYICPDVYFALLSDVYDWLYVQPDETYPLQFELRENYQIKPISTNSVCQAVQDPQSETLITITCQDTGEFVLQFDIEDTKHDVRYPLFLNLFSIPEKTVETPVIPPKLIMEEYELVQHPESDTRFFEPVTGTASEILAKHQTDRGHLVGGVSAILLENGAQIQAEITVEPGILHIAISQDGQTIFTTQAPVLANDTFLGLWAFGNHWFTEAMRLAENSFRKLTWGEIFQDGKSLNELNHYSESFNFQLMRGKPFYFFERDGRVGIVYDGQEILLGYDRVLHYGCCSAGSLNPIQYENMVGFFAARDGKWYYVEIGVFK